MKILVTILFDNEENKELADRDYDRVILEAEEGSFKETLLRYFEDKKYSWNKKVNGYKQVMYFETIDLTDLKIYK